MNSIFTFRNPVPTCLRIAFYLALTLSFSLQRAKAQNTPLCFQLFFPVVEADEGDTVCLPLRVRDFQQIASMQFLVTWDSSKLEFIHLDLAVSQVPVIGPGDFNVQLGNRLRFAWFDVMAMGVSLPDSAVLFSLCFRVKTNETGFYPVRIDEKPPGFPYEVVMFTLPDWVSVLMPMAQQIGGVAVNSGGASNLAISASCVANADCGAPFGSLSVETSGGAPPYQYHWSGPGGYSASTAAIDGLPGGVYVVTVTDQNGVSAVAEMTVESSFAQIYVQKYLQPAFCGQPTGCATLTVTGANPPFTFAWSAGNSQGNAACDLAPGAYAVSITDSLGCIRIDSVFIENDSTILLQKSIQHITDCNGTGSIQVVVEKGVGPFQYLWSTGDTVSIADSLSAGILYVVTVTGAGGCTAVTSAGIIDYSTAYWYLKLYKECVDSTGIPNGNLYLRFNNGGGIAFPALVSWSDGTTRLIPESPPSGYLDTLAGVTSGHYSATVTDADGCAVSTQIILNCTPPPPVPDSMTAFYILDEYVNPQYKVDSCVGVFARYFGDVYSLQFTLAWDTNHIAAKSIRHLNPDLPGLSMADFNLDSSGSLKFSWSDPLATGVSLPENSRLFEVCYEPKGPYSYIGVHFSEGRLGAAPSGDLPFLGKNGYVLFGLYFPAGPSVCEYAAIQPSCASDGHARILLDGCDVGDPVFGEYSHNGVYYNDLSGLMFADSGSYRIYAYQNAQSSNTFYAYIPGTSDSSSCVWPGDADDNNAVNHHDLLYIGLAYGATGAQRSGADLNWAGQECADWPLTTVNRHINYKNIDANGDGTVDAADTMAIVQNWSRVVNPATDNPFDAPLGNPTGNPDPPFTIETDTLSPGQMATLPLLLGSADMPVDSIYGLAFSISYDPAKVQSNISFQPSDSWLGDSSQMLWLQRNFPGQGRLDVAITRTDGMPVSGWGHIGDVFVIIEDDIFFAAGINEESEAEFFVDSVAKTTLFFSGLHPVNTTAAPGMLHAPPVELVILKTSSTAQEPVAWENKLSISPNPAAESIRIASPESMIRRVEMIDPTGTIVLLHNVSAGNITVPVHALSNGIYLVRIFTEQGMAVRKICVTR